MFGDRADLARLARYLLDALQAGDPARQVAVA
jgi:hypothetical protein